jgi:hypothetical protein
MSKGFTLSISYRMAVISILAIMTDDRSKVKSLASTNKTLLDMTRFLMVKRGVKKSSRPTVCTIHSSAHEAELWFKKMAGSHLVTDLSSLTLSKFKDGAELYIQLKDEDGKSMLSWEQMIFEKGRILYHGTPPVAIWEVVEDSSTICGSGGEAETAVISSPLIDLLKQSMSKVADTPTTPLCLRFYLTNVLAALAKPLEIGDNGESKSKIELTLDQIATDVSINFLDGQVFPNSKVNAITTALKASGYFLTYDQKSTASQVSQVSQSLVDLFTLLATLLIDPAPAAKQTPEQAAVDIGRLSAEFAKLKKAQVKFESEVSIAATQTLNRLKAVSKSMSDFGAPLKSDLVRRLLNDIFLMIEAVANTSGETIDTSSLFLNLRTVDEIEIKSASATTAVTTAPVTAVESKRTLVDDIKLSDDNYQTICKWYKQRSESEMKQVPWPVAVQHNKMLDDMRLGDVYKLYQFAMASPHNKTPFFRNLLGQTTMLMSQSDDIVEGFFLEAAKAGLYLGMFNLSNFTKNVQRREWCINKLREVNYFK